MGILGLKPKNSCTSRSKKNEGGISAPSETCKDFETDAAFLEPHPVYRRHEMQPLPLAAKKI